MFVLMILIYYAAEAGGNFTNASVANGLSSLWQTFVDRPLKWLVSAEPRSWQLSASSLTMIQYVNVWKCIWSKNNGARWPEHTTDQDFKQPCKNMFTDNLTVLRYLPTPCVYVKQTKYIIHITLVHASMKL